MFGTRRVKLSSFHAHLNREGFGGLREQALVHDGGQCPACGELDLFALVVITAYQALRQSSNAVGAENPRA